MRERSVYAKSPNRGGAKHPHNPLAIWWSCSCPPGSTSRSNGHCPTSLRRWTGLAGDELSTRKELEQKLEAQSRVFDIFLVGVVRVVRLFVVKRTASMCPSASRTGGLVLGDESDGFDICPALRELGHDQNKKSGHDPGGGCLINPWCLGIFRLMPDDLNWRHSLYASQTGKRHQST